ncbi:branched-chain amino acid transport system substrate-binding protein [Gammaproteobacteria bacterium]
MSVKGCLLISRGGNWFKALENTVKFWIVLWIVALTGMLAACSDWDDPRAIRASRAAAAQGDILIGAVWPWGGAKGDLWQGIELAVEEINAGGGLLNRKLRILKEDDESSLVKGRQIAQQFAENLDMVAVIGHLNSYIALPASAIYQSAGMVFMTPGAHRYQINNQGYDLVFRTIPSNRSLGMQTAKYMAAQGHRRVVIYYIKDSSSQGLANHFEQSVRELGLAVADRRSYMPGTQDFSNVIQNWKDLYQFDALFLAANMPEGAQFIVQMRKMGLDIPIVGGSGLDTHKLMEIAGTAAEGVVVPEIFVHDNNWPAYRHFSEIFYQKYRQSSGTQAPQGYDTIHLLAHAMRQANSSIPDKIAQALHGTQQWPGTTGEFTFDNKGDIPDKKIGMKVVRNGKFETVQ